MVKKSQHSSHPIIEKYRRRKDEVTRETILLALFYTLAWGGFLYLLITWMHHSHVR